MSLFLQNPRIQEFSPHVTMCSARFRAPPCPRKGLRPPEMNVLQILVLMNSFLPEQADTGRYGKELT